VRMVAEIRSDHDSEWAAMAKVSDLLGVGTPETVRKCRGDQGGEGRQAMLADRLALSASITPSRVTWASPRMRAVLAVVSAALTRSAWLSPVVCSDSLARLVPVARWLVFFACRRPGWGEQFGRLTAVGFVVCLGSSR